MVFLKEFFEKVDFEKNQQTTKKYVKSPSMQSYFILQFKEDKQADDEEIKRLNAELQRLKNALKEAQNRAKQVSTGH